MDGHIPEVNATSSASSDKTFGVVLFHSVHAALRAEKILLAANIQNKLIPVPRQFSSNCGFCLRFCWTERESIEQLLGNNLNIEAIHPL
jgi:hypothetical protein